MKTKTIIFLTFFSYARFVSAQTALFIDSSAQFFITQNTTITYAGNVTSHGIYRSHGTEIFKSSGDQTISGPVADLNFFGSIIKKNIGDITLNGDVDCHRIDFQTDGVFKVPVGKTLFVKDSAVDAITNYSAVRFVDVGDNQGFLRRAVGDTSTNGWYTFPLGNDLGYHQLDFSLQSLGATGSSTLCGTIENGQAGSIAFDTICTGSCDPTITFDCLGGMRWNFSGPNDCDYIVRTYGNPCGPMPARALRAPAGTIDWSPYVTDVVGDIATNLCAYTDWSGISDTIPGGVYLGFGDFAVVGGSARVLPVTWMNLRADAIDNTFIRVSWETAIEIENSGFAIERSLDAQRFEFIGWVDGNAATTTVHKYAFDDTTVVANVRYYYRLRQLDYDNDFEFSEIVSAKIMLDEILETKFLNVLGQEITGNESGIILVRTVTRNAIRTTKTVRGLQ